LLADPLAGQEQQEEELPNPVEIEEQRRLEEGPGQRKQGEIAAALAVSIVARQATQPGTVRRIARIPKRVRALDAGRWGM